jgi:DNA helicase-2/ATP-dependent DNA helicase PcrA
MFAPEQERWLSGLNPQQLAAATHRDGPLLILAGAGTGKTTTLCSRVAWLVSEGVDPERILLLTFTRRAAREMVQRARGLVGRALGGERRIVGGTFHSVAHRMVRLHSSALGLSGGYGVLDAGDAAGLLDLVRQEHRIPGDGRRFPRASTMLDIYSRTVNAQLPMAEVLAESFPWCAEHEEPLGQMFRAYAARKRELGLLDLDDLLLYWRALAGHELLGARLGEMFDHVLVDEYQDVNGLQVDIVRSLRASRRELTVVGDDFQAIYGFRAASADHIIGFRDVFPDATVVALEQNYRSTSPILAVANAVSKQDRNGHPKVLWTERDGTARPQLVFSRDDAEQAREVCDRVLEAREQGMELRAQAVLFRAAHDSDLLELELTRRDVPFVKYGGLRYLEAAHIKDLVAVLRLSTNPADEVSWFRVLQLLDGVGPARAERALEALRGSPGGVAALERWSEARAHLPPEASEAARELVQALGDDSRQTAAQRIEQLCTALAPLIRGAYPDWAARLDDFEQLIAAAGGAGDVAAFVGELVLDPPASSADLAGPPHLDEDFLVLSTVHSAKGLEWDAVHVLSAYDGNFPADMNTGSAEGIAEERRLLYVAITRARRRLHVYVPQRYYHRPHGRDDKHGLGRASRFLTEEVQRLFDKLHSPLVADASGHESSGPALVQVSVDSLFGG